MGQESRDLLKKRFEAGDKPSQQDFETLIDSVFVREDDDMSFGGGSVVTFVNSENQYFRLQHTSDYYGAGDWAFERNTSSSETILQISPFPGTTSPKVKFNCRIEAEGFSLDEEDLTVADLTVSGTSNLGSEVNVSAQLGYDAALKVSAGTGQKATLTVGDNTTQNGVLKVHGTANIDGGTAGDVDLTVTNRIEAGSLATANWSFTEITGGRLEIDLTNTTVTEKILNIGESLRVGLCVSGRAAVNGVPPSLDDILVVYEEFGGSMPPLLTVTGRADSATPGKVTVGASAETDHADLIVHGSLQLGTGNSANEIAKAAWNYEDAEETTIPTESAVTAYVDKGFPIGAMLLVYNDLTSNAPSVGEWDDLGTITLNPGGGADTIFKCYQRKVPTP